MLIATLNNLIVNGGSRFLNKAWFNDISINGAASLDTATLGTATASSLTVSGTSTLTGAVSSGQITSTGAVYSTGFGRDATMTIIPSGSNEVNFGGTGSYGTGGTIYIGYRAASSGGKTSGAPSQFVFGGNSGSATLKAGALTLSGAANITTVNANTANIKGTLRSETWDIQNITQLYNDFGINPSFKLSSSATVQVQRSGTTVTMTIKDSVSIASDTIGGVVWANGSQVKVFGTLNGTVLGTCSGVTTAKMNTTAGTLSLSFTGLATTDPLYIASPTTATTYSVSAGTVKEFCCMLYSVGDYPVGIRLTSYGTNKSSQIDIYGGTTGSIANSRWHPVVRIGKLDNMLDASGNQIKINGESPTGWGLYTNHGYFDGVIVSQSGKIANFTIADSQLYSSTKASFDSNVSGVYIGTNGIALGAYDSTSGVVSCPFQVTSDGSLIARSGRIGKFNITNSYLYTGSGSTEAGMGGNQAFWAGSADSNNAPFRVSYAGVLNATGAVLKTVSLQDSNGNTRATVNTNGLIVKDASGNTTSIFGAGTATIGYTSGNKYNIDITGTAIDLRYNANVLNRINSSGMTLYDGQGILDNNKIAQFGENVIIGSESKSQIFLSKDSIYGFGENKKEFFNFSGNGGTSTVSYTEYLLNQELINEIPTSQASAATFVVNDIANASSTDINSRITFISRNGDYIGLSGITFSKNGETQQVSRDATGIHPSYVGTIYIIYDGNMTFKVYRSSNVYSEFEYIILYITYYKDSSSPTYIIGADNSVSGGYSLAVGKKNTISGAYSAGIGYGHTVSGDCSFAEGANTYIPSDYSHAEGQNCWAKGDYSHSEGAYCQADGDCSHAEGSSCYANGNYSHAQNLATQANSKSQTVVGEHNIVDTSGSATTRGTYAFIVGNGTSSVKSNAFTVEWNGNVNIRSGAKYQINGVALTASDVGAVPTTRTVNSKALSSNISLTASDVGAVPTTRTVNSKALSSNISLTASDVGAVSTSTGTTLTHNSIAVQTTSYAAVGSVAANSYKSSSVSVPSVTNYKARCIVGWNFRNATSSQSGETVLFLNRAYVDQDEQKIYYTVRNCTSTAYNPSVRFFVLYTRNS